MKRTLNIAWKIALLAAVAAFIFYRLRFAPIPVASQAAATGSIVSQTMGTGTLEARVQADISAKIPGRLVEVLADQADRVTRGQLLATLDDGELRQQVEMAKAEVAATQAAVDRSEAEITRAQVTAAQSQTDFSRTSSLRKSESATQYELEKAAERRDIAEAELKRAQLARVENERQVAKARESLRYFQERLADTRITCPFDGLVIRRNREPGDVVVPGATILQLISTDELWISAWVDESALASIAVGQPARVVFRSEPGRTYTGTVTRIAPLADRETREFLVDVTVKELPRTWAIGQRAEVYIQTASRNDALIAPSHAILWQQEKPGVFVADAGHAHWRSIDLGLRGEKTIEIREGLSPGEIVIWPRNPQDALAEGRAVTVP